MLTKTNYPEWVTLMRINLQAQGLWTAIKPGGDVEYNEDQLALVAIARSVPLEMVNTIGSKDTTQEVWGAMKVMRVGIERVRVANAQMLRRDFNNIASAFKEGENMDEFSMRIAGLANNLRLLGDEIDDVEVVRKLLQVVPDRFMQVAISIETLLDVEELSIEEVIGCLRAMEHRLEARAVAAKMGSHLLLSSKEEELIRRLRKRDKEGSRDGNIGDGGSGTSSVSAPPRHSTHPPKRFTDTRRGDGGSKPVDKDACKYCGKTRHWKRECLKRKKDLAASEALLAEEGGVNDEPSPQSEDDELALLMARLRQSCRDPGAS